MTGQDHDKDYLKGLRLLYVEDEPATREEMGYFLGRMVGALTVAANGAEGLEAFKRDKPDLIITDIMMPATDGLTMASAIRDLEPQIPIVVTTAFERTDYLMRSIDVGIDRYVIKPVDMGKLAEALFACARRLRAEALFRRQQEQDAELRRHEAFGMLAGGMAHDYNNLLQGLTGCIDLAKMVAEEGCPTIEYLERAEKIAFRGRELGAYLQILAKGGMIAFAVAPVAPTLIRVVKEAFRRNQATDNLRKAVSAVMNDTPLSLEFEIAPDLPEIEHDEGMLATIFTHLTVNALEAMPTGGKLRVIASVRAVPPEDDSGRPPGRYLEILFRDQGIGVPPERRPLIFQPYFTTKERGSTKGMGLGLALCRSIIGKHHGTLDLESAPGQGSTFRVLLPVKQPAS